jgi:hypothetical protein
VRSPDGKAALHEVGKLHHCLQSVVLYEVSRIPELNLGIHIFTATQRNTVLIQYLIFMEVKM